MAEEATRKTRRWLRRKRYRSGCGGFILVLTVGVILSLFGIDVGLGASVRVPFTNANLTLAGAIGAKERAADSLPNYARNRVGSNQDFVDYTGALTLWPAEGIALLVIGKQDGAPPILDIHLDARSK